MREIKIGVLHLIIFIYILCTGGIAVAQTRISGNVKDTSGEVLPYTTVRLKDTHIGCTTDNNGNFSFTGPTNGETLIISSIGYEDFSIKLSSKTIFPINVTLVPTTYDISEVEIKPERERYRRENNPALELAKELISKKESESPYQHEYVSKNRYEKFNIALDNFNEEKQQQLLFRRFDFLKEYIDTSFVSGKPILNISSRELVATDYYQRRPEKEKQVIQGRNWVGADDFLPEEEIRAMVEATLVDIDLFNNKIIILRNEFVSPLAEIAPLYYKYYIMDTISIDNTPCIDLAFVPNNTQSFGFTGHLYVTADSTHFIKWVQMSIPHDINFNFVEYMNIEQRFEKDNLHPRLLVYESITTELKLYDFIDGVYAHREVYYSDYRFDNEVNKEPFNRPERVIEESYATERGEEFWAQYRNSSEEKRNKSIKDMLERLRKIPVYYWTEKFVSFMFSGYVPIKEENTPFYYGPVNTTASYNGLEGLRLRVGGMTTSHLNPHLFSNFYIAYGTKDERLKYMANIEYSFKPKKEHANEFPIHSLRLKHENDIYQYGQQYLYTNKDNALLSLKRLPDNRIGYIKQTELIYSNEFYNGFSYSATLRNRINESSYLLPLEKVMSDGSIKSEKQITQSEFEIKLRYAPNETFTQSKWNRHSMKPEFPVFTLSHTIAQKGILGSDYTIHHTEASYRQRLWISMFGYFDVIMKGGKIWNQAPYPLMIIPNANLSYTIRKESFELMTPMEFILDSHATWDISYYMNGLIFNRTPLLKKLNLREVITFKGVWGSTMDCNIPNISNSGDIYIFPKNVLATNMVEPYMEIGFGIENILKFGRIDYYRRLTYKDTPGVSTQGIRIAVHAQF